MSGQKLQSSRAKCFSKQTFIIVRVPQKERKIGNHKFIGSFPNNPKAKRYLAVLGSVAISVLTIVHYNIIMGN